MMEAGTVRLDVLDDGQGGLTGQFSFTVAGGTEAQPLGYPFPVAAGTWATIDPSCVECEMVTTVSSGSGGEPVVRRTTTARGPAAVAKPGGPHGGPAKPR